MPGNDIEGAVVLLALEELAAEFVNNLPWVVFGDFITGHRTKKISHVRQPVRTQGTEFWQLEIGAPYFEDVATSCALDANLEPLSSLDHANLTRLNVELTEFSLNIQSTLLWDY